MVTHGWLNKEICIYLVYHYYFSMGKHINCSIMIIIACMFFLLEDYNLREGKNMSTSSSMEDRGWKGCGICRILASL